MDRLRALEYFVAAAEAGSFAGAARRLDVTVPAVAKLVGALERRLGAQLFERSRQGLTLTADGHAYRETCAPLLDDLAAADEALRAAAGRARGTVTVGTLPHVARHVLMPLLPRFRARHPDIQVDFETGGRTIEPDSAAADLLVLPGWPQRPDLVQRRIAHARLLVCAAPTYWNRRGLPQHPRDLVAHDCLVLRSHIGTALDLWTFERAVERHAVAVAGWLVSDHRDLLLDAALDGLGVVRISELMSPTGVFDGRRLVPVLLDWQAPDSPPINLLYRPQQRRVPRVRLFIDFIAAAIGDLQRERVPAGTAPDARPQSWHGRRVRRASAAARQPR